MVEDIRVKYRENLKRLEQAIALRLNARSPKKGESLEEDEVVGKGIWKFLKRRIFGILGRRLPKSRHR